MVPEVRRPLSNCCIIASLLVAVTAAAGENSLLGEGSHCVAYKVHKTTLFVKSDSVVGRNCDVSAQVLPEVGGMYHIEVNIPIRSFSSGDSERDRDVMKILKAESRPELTFKSFSRTAEQWRELFAKKDFSLDGDLSMGLKSFPVTLSSRYTEKQDNAEIDGSANVKFENFDLRPPKVAGGIIANVKQDFELHFHFVSGRILGADSIKLNVEKEKE